MEHKLGTLITRWGMPKCALGAAGAHACHASEIQGHCQSTCAAPCAPQAGAAGTVSVQGAVTHRVHTVSCHCPGSLSGRGGSQSHPSTWQPEQLLDKMVLGLSAESERQQCGVTQGNTMSWGQLQGIMSSDSVIHRTTRPWRATVSQGLWGLLTGF